MEVGKRILCALAMLLAETGAVQAAPSAVYCLHGKGKDFSVFVAKVLPDGRLEYGLDKWMGEQNIGVTGFADKKGDVWISSRDVTAGNPDRGCRLIIDFDIRGVTRVKADPLANCRSAYSVDDDSPPDPLVGTYSGGAGTFIDETYPRNTIIGSVTTEFDDLVEFFEEPQGLVLKCR